MLAPDSRAAYTRAELARLIAPRSVAIVGASPRAGSFGMRTLENLAHYGGAIYPVNAKYPRIGERACYASPPALPHPGMRVLVVAARRRGGGDSRTGRPPVGS